MRSATVELLDYLSYSARITSVMLTLCAGVALAQSSLFNLSGIFPVGSGSEGNVASTAMVVADFNRDGKADIVTANTNDGTLTLLLGDGKGHFTQAPGSPIEAADKFVQAIATGDFNGDGNPDLVVTGAGTEILLGDGTGKFVKGAGIPSAYNLGASGDLLAVADFNGDGKLDLVIVGASIAPSIFLGDGTGGFGSTVSAPFSANISDVVVGDFNGDGKMDLASIDAINNTYIRVGAGDGAGKFQQIFLETPYGYTWDTPIAAGDFHGNGKSDFLYFTSFQGATLQSWDWSWTGSTSAPFPFSPTRSTVPSLPTFVVTADFNGDGKLDWAGVDAYSGTVIVALGDGTGAFTPAPGSPYTVGGAPFALAACDFNGDGKTDLAVDTGSSVTILLNGNSSSTEAPPVLSAVVNAASYISEPLPGNSYAVVYGSNLAASVGDPTVAVTVTDVNAKQVAASVIYAGPGQINVLVPDGLALGAGSLKVSNSLGVSPGFPVTVGSIAPGLFTVDTAGRIPAAQVLTVAANEAQTFQPVANCTSDGCDVVPIVLNPSEQTYLILYGTGIRGRSSLSDVSVTIGGESATVLYAGPQGGYPGLDQVNVLLPQALAGSKQVNVELRASADAANVVQVVFQ